MVWQHDNCAEPNSCKCYKILEKYIIQCTPTSCQASTTTPLTTTPSIVTTQGKKTLREHGLFLQHGVGYIGISLPYCNNLQIF